MAIDYVNREGLEYFHSKLKTYLSTKYATKEELEAAIANFGGFQVVSLNQQGKPDVAEPSTKIIYLTKEAGSSKTDPYTEWICTNTTGPVWEVIGETTPEINEMIGATASTAGTAGLVPAPAAGDQGKVLTGDGNWSEVEEYTTTYIDGLPWLTGPSVVIGGREYPVVQIGNQLWMTKNLDIVLGTLGTDSFYYDNDPTRSDSGMLYKLRAVVDISESPAPTYYNLSAELASLVPQGWRLPKISDLSAIETMVGGNASKLKSTSWNGTDELGLNLIPSGYKMWNSDSSFGGLTGLGACCRYWELDSGSYQGSKGRSFGLDNNGFITGNDEYRDHNYGLSVRLIKDLT